MGHFTPKIKIVQEVLLTGIPWTPKSASTKKVDRLGPIPQLWGGHRLTPGEKTSNRAREPGAEASGDPGGKPAAVLTLRLISHPALDGQKVN